MKKNDPVDIIVQVRLEPEHHRDYYIELCPVRSSSAALFNGLCHIANIDMLEETVFWMRLTSDTANGPYSGPWLSYSITQAKEYLLLRSEQIRNF